MLDKISVSKKALIKSVLNDVDRSNAKKLADLFSCIPLGLSQTLVYSLIYELKYDNVLIIIC